MWPLCIVLRMRNEIYCVRSLLSFIQSYFILSFAFSLFDFTSCCCRLTFSYGTDYIRIVVVFHPDVNNVMCPALKDPLCMSVGQMSHNPNTKEINPNKTKQEKNRRRKKQTFRLVKNALGKNYLYIFLLFAFSLDLSLKHTHTLSHSLIFFSLFHCSFHSKFN